MNRDIFDRDKNGETISLDDPEFPKMAEAIERAQKRLARLNHSYHDAPAVRSIFSELTGAQVHESFELLPPFYTDFGQNIRIGKEVFINQAAPLWIVVALRLKTRCSLRQKILRLTTPSRQLSAEHRYSKPILIKKGAWIGINATIMPGVTIGENAIVSAGAVVTKEVEDNVIVAGVPAKVIMQIEVEA
ncbi:LOW QUALITY PROTEIN: hypothetical protein JCM19046_3439 [Bacillus sp. JCM 19046]|nr:LOW QUALITY PROTEIN: hypothetical protein JCM19046_3439 [Bacillus sp. JCM 19046]